MAAFRTATVWPQRAIINIAFMQTEHINIPRTHYTELELQNTDPLQLLLQDMPIPQAIVKIVEERIAPIINLNLRFIDNTESADVKISFDESGGSWSLLGTLCKREKGATMNFGWFDVATVMHEFGHMLSLIHEHQNPRGNTIQWDEDKVYKWGLETQGWDKTTTYNNIIARNKMSEINGSKYDPQSIMLYFFPAELTINNKGTNQNLRLSLNDIIFISQTYPRKALGMSPGQMYKEMYPSNFLKKAYIFVITVVTLGLFYIIISYNLWHFSKLQQTHRFL